MPNLFRSSMKKAFIVFHFKLFYLLLFSLFFGSQMILNAEQTQSNYSDCCHICHRATIISPVYPAVLQEKFNPEKMVLECKVKKLCKHIFCKECITNLMKKEDELFFINRKDHSYKCPSCFESFSDLFLADAKNEMGFEKTLKDLSGDKLICVVGELCKQRILDKALEITKLIPNIENENYGNGDSTCSITYSHVSIKNGIFLQLSEAYREKDDLDKALEILDNDLNLSEQEVESDFLLQVSSQYIGIKKPNKALEILDKALDILDITSEIAESIVNDNCDKQQVYLSILAGYVKAKKMDKSLEFLGKALDADSFFQTEKERFFVTTFNDYVKEGRLDKALKTLKNSLELVESILDIKEDSEKKVVLSKIVEEKNK